MKKLLAAAMLLVPAMLFAQSPFDGTWKTDLGKAKFSPKPIIFSVKGGMYDCSSCSPKIHVKADGTDQPVTGQPFDTLSVKEVDPHTVQLVTKKNGKTVFEQTRTASDDGKTLSVKTSSYPLDSPQAITTESTLEREGKPSTGANAISGSWKLTKANESDNGLLVTFKGSGDELTMSDPTGVNWTAKFDGRDSPVKGSYGFDSVSLKQINDRTIEVSYKRGGKLIEVDKMTVSTDGKAMTTVSESKLTGRVSTFESTKQ
jgi:hypothetical protein